MAKLNIFIGIIAVLIFSIAACSTSQTAPSDIKTEKSIEKTASSRNVVSVTIQGFKFLPADVTVKVGDVVVWANQDSVPHTVESSDGTLKSDELSKGDTYKFTFTKAGKYDYNCGIHKSMHGSVMVQ